MPKDLLDEINTDQFRENLIKYTRKAFQMLPELEKPRILDIGCGSGVVTIELAKLSDGEILGIDIDQSVLDTLNRNVKEEGFSDRMKSLKCSIFEIDFPDKSFEIVWAEGLQFIDFEMRLKEWKRLLTTNGFLVLHDGIRDMSDKLRIIPRCGYRLIEYFLLPEDAWWTEYYSPLERRLKELRRKYNDVPEALKIFKNYEKEIDMVKKNPKDSRSVFYIMQKLSSN